MVHQSKRRRITHSEESTDGSESNIHGNEEDQRKIRHSFFRLNSKQPLSAMHWEFAVSIQT